MTKDCLGGMLFTTTNSSGALPPVIHQTSPPPPHTSQLHNNSYQHQYHNTSYSWDRRYNELVEYMAEHGNCDVPQKYETNPRLGYWVATQRTQHKYHIEGKQSSLNNEKIERLESIGFNWRVRNIIGNNSWDRRFKELVEYKFIHGDCDVPFRYRLNTSLGNWVATQRAQHKYHIEGKQSSLNNEKIERLESIGFNWRVRNRSPKRKIDDLAEALVDEIRLDLPNNEFMNTLDDDQEEPTKKKTKISRPSKTWTEHN